MITWQTIEITASQRNQTRPPTRKPFLTSDIQASLKERYKDVIQPKREAFNQYLEDKAVKEWVQQETTVRKQKYYPVKHILAISPI